MKNPKGSLPNESHDELPRRLPGESVFDYKSRVAYNTQILDTAAVDKSFAKKVSYTWQIEKSSF